ncbi:VIT and VWA domain-containing protein [Variovorax dokdonensis]|uniref:VIT and VWA domain-containing protein n=1 Tax=Variovorax dokdonensis TaxID=344883 RepID=A0ABT7NFV2_9BURK|nr:VIT and VWA domain-containing protein [Variovorax dokdonensis]MDM0046750.1 VIT and VWA domain-containing protein [Variovorax dokdonensis]
MPSHRRARQLWIVTLMLAIACFILLLTQPAQAQDLPRQKTESPYFQVRGGDASLDRLPLKSTDVDVQIAGPIARVRVTQAYRNEGTRTLEASYVFPGSTRAAVDGLTIRLGNRLVEATIREKQQARREYDEAQKEGKTAALLEQHQPNVFQMKVANILPGDEVRVELRYSELLVPEDGQYQFVFPTVVGPRYNSPASENAQARWVAQPILRAGDPPTARFSMKVGIDTPVPIATLRSRTHAADIAHETGSRHAQLTLGPDANAANRDFVLDFSLAGAAMQTGVMLYPGQGPDAENFFLAMVQPPASVPAQSVLPREYIFVVDISGSMHGFPLDTAKTMLNRLIGGLRPSDTFNVMLFAGSNEMLSPRSVPATRANIDRAVQMLGQTRGGGSTELIPALREVYRYPRSEQVSRTVVVVTDGYVTVEREAFELVRRNLSQANVFAFGIGSSVNRHLIEGLARAGMGEPFVITDPVQAEREAARFRRMVESPVLTQVKARFEGLDAYDVTPQALPDVLGNRPLVVFGKWRGKPQGRLVIDGKSAQGPWRESLAIGSDNVKPDATALQSLWARHKVAELEDQAALEGGDALREPITQMGLRYRLLTSHTSFIAVDHVVRASPADGSTRVDQPLPLPHGVSELAVGDASGGVTVPGTPEPETLGAMALVLSMLAMLHRRARRRDPRRFTE